MMMVMILEDTRQQEKKHEIKHEYFRNKGVHWNRAALYCGDYTLPADQSVCIDTKKDIQELIGDIQIHSMSKKEIRQKVFEISEKEHIGFDLADQIYRAICDDDVDRFAEKEINDLCFKHGVSEHVMSAFQRLYIKRHGFFHRGLKRAQNSGIRLIILVANKEGVADLKQLDSWRNPRMDRYNKIQYMHSIGKWKNVKLPKSEPMCGERLAKACETMQARYGCEFTFCSEEEQGKRVLELLGIEV